MTDAVRKEFEAWCVKRWGGDRGDDNFLRYDDSDKHYAGQYRKGNVEFAWCAWAAARAALAEQPAPRVCKGIPRVGCNYLAECDSVCNKCGKVHAVHLIPGVGSTAPVERVALSVTDDMVSRFLSWPLPRDFYPDCGISFDGRRDDEWNKNKTWPIGTNLLTAIQARQMLEHVLGVAHGDME